MKHQTLLALLLVACSAGQGPKKADFPDTQVEEDPIAGTAPNESSAPSRCQDNEGKAVECLSDKDCCPGFYCGIDPEGSTRIKICIYGGE